jgi:DNA-binding transcriptional ArsR family regulator
MPGLGVDWTWGDAALSAQGDAEQDWLKVVLFDRGYLARLKGESIKVYLAMLETSGGFPGRSVQISVRSLVERTRLSSPAVSEALARLEELGLVVSTTRERGKVKTYYVADPPAVG